MNIVEKRLRHHLELSYDTINRYGVSIISDGPFTINLHCLHPGDYTNTIYIWFNSVGAKELMNRFGVRKIEHLELITPQQMQIVFDGQRWGQLYVNAEKGTKQMECVWKTGQLRRVESHQYQEILKYDPDKVYELIQYAEENIPAVQDEQ